MSKDSTITLPLDAVERVWKLALQHARQGPIHVETGKAMRLIESELAQAKGVSSLR